MEGALVVVAVCMNWEPKSGFSCFIHRQANGDTLETGSGRKQGLKWHLLVMKQLLSSQRA